MQIPVSVITGFLGAGKTTLLNRLLAEPVLSDSMVIVNEFGEIGLDHLIIAAPTENTVLLRNGCLCCTVRGELTATLLDLHARVRDGTLPGFARVLVETTGLADPVPVLQSLLGDDELANDYRVGHVITVVDAVNGAAQLAASFEAQKQAAVADRIVLSKTDLAADETAVRALEDGLRAMNPGAVLAHAVHGQVGTLALLDAIATGGAADWSRDRLDASRAAAEGGPESMHGDIRTFALSWSRPSTQAGLLSWLHMLASFKGPDLLRMKGIVNVDERPVLVNAVQRLLHDPVALDAWPDADRTSRVVFITRGIGRDELEPTLAALGYSSARSQGTLDPERYAAFVRLAGLFGRAGTAPGSGTGPVRSS